MPHFLFWPGFKKYKKLHFLQYFAAYKQTFQLPRNLKFCMLSINLLSSVFIKFHVNAPIFEGAMYKKVQKITFLQHFAAY